MTTHNKNEELVLAHFEAHATDEQKQAAKAAGKTPAGAMAYAYEQARALPRHPGTRSQTQTLRCFRGKFFVAFAKRIAQSGKGV